MGVEDSYIMRKVKGFKVGDKFTMNTEDEAHEQVAFLARWGLTSRITDTCVTITADGRV
jgi:hypothetical protein